LAKRKKAKASAMASCCGSMLCPKCLGLSIGLIWAIAVFVMSMLSATGYSPTFMSIINETYLGTGPGLMGSLIGLAYGFVDGFIGGYLVAWVYNKICKC